MVKFKDYFRDTDILLIDDIQFMNGKRPCRKNFFIHLIFIRQRISIIVSADRAPNKLSRIKRELNQDFQGLVVDIQKPDFD